MDFLPKAEPAPENPPSSQTDRLGQSIPPVPSMGLNELGGLPVSLGLPVLSGGSSHPLCHGNPTAKWGLELSQWSSLFYTVIHYF